jgi:hypothetical protein
VGSPPVSVSLLILGGMPDVAAAESVVFAAEPEMSGRLESAALLLSLVVFAVAEVEPVPLALPVWVAELESPVVAAAVAPGVALGMATLPVWDNVGRF